MSMSFLSVPTQQKLREVNTEMSGAKPKDVPSETSGLKRLWFLTLIAITHLKPVKPSYLQKRNSRYRGKQ